MSLAADILQSYLRAGDAQDYPTVARALHKDLVTHSPGGMTMRGLEANLDAWKAAHDGLDLLEHRVVAVVAEDNSVAARVAVTGRHTGSFLGVAPTGAHLAVDQALFARLHGHQIVELWEIVDTGSGLQQLGVLGPQALGPGPS